LLSSFARVQGPRPPGIAPSALLFPAQLQGVKRKDKEKQ
jgi:hypothetical protein